VHCLIGCLAFLAPRLTIILLQLASGYVGRAYATLLWPVLGWIFMPLTTLAYAWARNTYGTVEGFGVVVVVLAVLLDLGIIGKGRSSLARGKTKDAE
jgi:hypothetical protein